MPYPYPGYNPHGPQGPTGRPAPPATSPYWNPHGGPQGPTVNGIPVKPLPPSGTGAGTTSNNPYDPNNDLGIPSNTETLWNSGIGEKLNPYITPTESNKVFGEINGRLNKP